MPLRAAPLRKMPHWLRVTAIIFGCVLLSATVSAEPVEGLAMHGKPKHALGFTHFPYTNPDAPKGGRIVLGALGTFDSLNPFIIRGVTPSGVREYVYESLMARSGDEPFSLYGLIAQSVDMPDDRSAITFNLRPEARFSDGMPITPEDVLYSHQILKEKGWPYHRSHYAKVAAAAKTGPHSVRFTFNAPGDREIPLIMGLLPVLPRHLLAPEAFDRTTLEAPVGSGPYRLERIDAGRSVTYRRNPDWWARDLPVTRGRFNFDEIRVEYFRDASSLFEAFKAGDVHVRAEDDPGRWIEGYRFPAVTDGRVIKREFETGLPSGMTALVFNTRRPVFEDARVRRAFLLLFDGAWINRSLFNGGYQRTQSFFERSMLSS
ncbi:MAG TPA: extracellular solute-binding protein, partial [Hyphomicrobiaceae bacterium]|nr:extracellular solute-binding protein [Hyphomicrobiaceae bacterium]